MADSELKRTHPATVAVRTARWLWQALLVYIGLAVFGSISRGGWQFSIGAGLALLAVIVAVAFSWLAWSRFRYGLSGGDLLIVEGIFVVRRRTIPLARVQGVNVKADLFLRLLGLADVIVQTAGGGDRDAEATVGAIKLSDAEALRHALLQGRNEAAAADATQTATIEPMGADPIGRMSDFRGALGGSEAGRVLSRFEYKVPTRDLVIAGLTSRQVPIIAAAMIAASFQLIEIVGAAVIEQAAGALLSLAIPLLLALVLVVVLGVAAVAVTVSLARDFGFVARRVDERIETEAGLLERRMTGMPIRRIQAVRIEQTWLRRVFGYAMVRVETAGFGQNEGQGSGISALIPLAKLGAIRPLMHGLIPEAEEFPAAHGVPRRALRFYVLVPTLFAAAIALIATTSTATALPVALWGIVPLGIVAVAATAAARVLMFRAAGVGADNRSLVIRGGALGHRQVRISRTRIQSMSVRQNPFQRRAGLATLIATSVSGSSGSAHVVRHMEQARAAELVGWYERATPTRTGSSAVAEPAPSPSEG